MMLLAQDAARSSFELFDWVVVILYFAIVMGVAIFVTRSKRTRETSAGYFLAGRHAGWLVIGASLFASNIGSEHLIGLAGAGFSIGLAIGHYEVLASLILLLLGWVFAPFYLRSAVYTMPEFLERRYGPAARWYLAIVSIIAYVLTKISVTIYAGTVFFAIILPDVPFWGAAVIIVALTGAYTFFGGLRAVLWTELLQTFVLLGGALAVTLLALDAAGGWSGVQAAMPPESDRFNMWKPMSDPDAPWTGVLLGAPLLGIWYWCTDQFIVQRVLSARDLKQARYGTILAGFLKILPIFLFLFPGIIALALHQQGRISMPLDPNGLARGDQALPVLVTTLLPLGLKGLVVAGFLAALMSSLAACFNSCATLVTFDVYRKLRPQASEKTLVRVGQITTLVLIFVGIAWVPVVPYLSQAVYQYLQSVQAYIAPPIAAAFLLGIFFKRLNLAGVMTAFITGFVLGMGRLALELVHKATLVDGEHVGLSGTILEPFVTIHFLHFAAFLFVLCSALLVIVSFTTKPRTDAELAGLTFQTTPPPTPEERRASRSPGVIIASIGVVLAVAAVWIFFSPIFF